MSKAVKPTDESGLVQLIRWAAAEEKTVELLGAGSKRGFGRPIDADLAIDLTGFGGIVDYQPEELVVTLRAGTPIAALDATLRQRGQMLPFEPADLGPLYGFEQQRATIGGIVGCNLSGPRRIKAGAARDHVLGVAGVSGMGEAFRAGGKVVKNVTGYDLSKLVTGSFGTLAALTEVTLKVLPLPEKTRTLLILGLDDRAAIDLLCEAAGSSYEVSGLAHLPRDVAGRSLVDYVRRAGTATTAIRIEGPAPSVAVRLEGLRKLADRRGALEELHGTNSAALWAEIRDVAPLLNDNAQAIWRLSVAPTEGPETIARLRRVLPDFASYYDWSGGLIWLSVPEADDAQSGRVRAAMPRAGGHATLIRASDEIRRRAALFQPETQALAALTRRVKAAYDPKGVLNPGRMYSGI